jgi:hypothetical protein
MRQLIKGALAVIILAGTLTACGPFKKASKGGEAVDKPGAVTVTTQARPKQLLPDSFKGNCDGATYSFAKPYDKTATGHKAIFFETYRDHGYLDESQYLPDDWTVKFDAATDAYAAVDLTICAKRTAEAFVKDCTGYTVDDKPDPLVVKMFSATYTVTAHESNTGKELGTKTLKATNADCPTSLFGIDKGTTTMNDYAQLTDEQVAGFAKPYVLP